MIFTRDFVTRENYWQFASLVTQKSLFTVTHALFFIACGNSLLPYYFCYWLSTQQKKHWYIYHWSLSIITHTIYNGRPHGICFPVNRFRPIWPYCSVLFHQRCGHQMVAPVWVEKPWRRRVKVSSEYIKSDDKVLLKSNTKLCSYFIGCIVYAQPEPKDYNTDGSQQT